MTLQDLLKKDLTLQDLQYLQKEYDRRFVDEKFCGFEKVRHTTLHVAKLLGKLANYCERKEHGENVSSEQIEKEIIPDLLVYALWLSKEFNVNPQNNYLERIVGNIERLYSDKISSEELEKLKRAINF